MTTDGTAKTLDDATGFEMREIVSDDATAAGALVLAGLAEHWGAVDPSLNRDLDDLVAAYPTGRTLVVVDRAGRVVGTGTVVPRDGGDVEVLRMSVATCVRGSGIGRRILEGLIDVARSWGAQRVVLETTATWTATVAFYERCGFRITHDADGNFGRDAWFERRLDGTSPAVPKRSGRGSPSHHEAKRDQNPR